MFMKAYCFFIVIFMMVSIVICQAQSTSNLVLNLPIGKSGLMYEGEENSEMLIEGPSAIAVGLDGTFWIANPVNHSLCQYNYTGDEISKIDTSFAIGLTDFCVTEKGIFILDAADPSPMVYHLDLRGSMIAKYPSPVALESGLSGITYTSEGGLILEQEGGAYLTQLIDPSGKFTNVTLAGYPYNGKLYRTEQVELQQKSRQTTINLGECSVNISTQNQLAGTKILNVAANGDVYIIVEEMKSNPEIWIDKTIHRYNTEGQFLGITRVPLMQRYGEVLCGLAIDKENEIYSLVTLPYAVQIYKLAFSQTIVEKPSLPEITNFPEPARDFGERISRDGIIANARAYIDNSKYLNSTNLNGSCSGRTKPDYLGGAGTYNSVPYDWGGWDTVSAFNSYMDKNYQAGDVNTSASESCSKGVDCSGFTTRSWGRTDKKYGTSTLPQIAKQFDSTDNLLKGDILNKAGSHVRLFASFANGGCNVYESTTGSYDRVIYRYLSWSSFSGYVPFRYLHISDDDPTPPTPSTWPTHSTATNNSGHNVYAIQYLLKQHGQSLNIDGDFGSETKSKVQNVQTAYNLTADGVVAESTWKVLIKTVSQGSNGDAVKAVQHLLKNKFGFSLTIDGDFGPNTKSAVISFQNSKGLTADGIVGTQTWLALVSK